VAETVAIDVVPVDDYFAQIDAYAKLQALVVRNANVTVG
jgi:hypothetical protein